MPFTPPVIDDRSYSEIVAEARTRIPRYTPEWTDQNESDPGMILVELFAWLTEMQIFRMSKIPELAYVKFLELVGITPEPARSARAYVTFPVRAGYSKPTTIVPARTQVAAAEQDESGKRIVFETERALTSVRAALDRLQTFDGFAYRDVSGENLDASGSFEPFGTLVNAGASFLLGFAAELPPAALTLACFVPDDERSPASFECAGARASFVSSEIAWEYWDGSEWRALDVLRDETARFTRTGCIELKGPPNGRMRARVLGKVLDAPRFWIRARLTKSGYEMPPRLLAIRTNTTLATQAETLRFEVLGGSDARAAQEFSLADVPILDGSLRLEVDEGTGFQRWLEVPDFFGSGVGDAHYVLDRTTGKIRFGDGRRGRIPVANPRQRANVRALEYRVGGGARGNVGAGMLSVLQASVEGIDASAVTNLLPAAGGVDEEPLARARERAPLAIRSRDRAVTASDYEELAGRLVARAKALPLHHPKFPGVEVPGVVTVVVVPRVDTAVTPAPVPSEGTLRAVCAYLDERRTLTTELYVIGPRYREITIEAELVAADDADLAAVKSAATAELVRYFDPLSGGEGSTADTSGTGWPFGGAIVYSRLYRRLSFDSVSRIASLTIKLDGEAHEPCRDVPLDAGFLLRNGEHAVEVRYE
jgi:predicted phage baseplate assembly protein